MSPRPSGSHLEEVLEVGLDVGLALQQGGGVELAGAEADVRLQVRQLRRQQVADEVHRHVVAAALLARAQSPAGRKAMQRKVLALRYVFRAKELGAPWKTK